MQWPSNRFQQFPLRRAARPSAPELVFFLVHVFEADGFHLGHAPLFGFSFRGRSRHARSKVIAQLGEVLEGVRIHHPFACNLDERRLRAILIRPFRRRPIVCPRRPRSAKRKSQCHHPRQNTSHPLSPYAFRADRLYHCVRRARHGTVSGGPQRPLTPSASAKLRAQQQAESPPRCPSPSRNPAPLSSLPLPAPHPTLPFVGTMKPSGRLLLFLRTLSPLLLIAFVMRTTLAQQPVQKPREKTSEKKAEKAAPSEKEANPAQIELLETRYRFEANGDSRKEVHARVHINSELGVRQFARLNFDYNRAFQSIDIPLVRITHPSGGTADILPSAITDNPNPAVINAPAYQDVRVKSVRVLGLAPGDNLEYRVITTVSHHPLAPDFWLDHSFDRTGIVSQEFFETDVPASRKVQLHVAPESPYEIIESESRTDAHVVYRWHRQPQKVGAEAARQSESAEPDVILSTFQDWREMVNRIAPVLRDNLQVPEVLAKAAELSQSGTTPEDKFRALYDFVSQKILTVDLPLGTTGFRVRSPLEVISSGYAIPEEKCALLSVLGSGIKGGPRATPALALSLDTPKDKPPRISALSRVLVEASLSGKNLWLDPAIEVAPLGLVPSDLRGKFALRLFSRSDSDDFDRIEIGR